MVTELHESWDLDELIRTLRWAVDGGGFEDATQTEVCTRAALEELERLREEIASDEGSFREALTALKLVADQRDALKVAARDYRFAHPCEDPRCEAAVALREALER